MPVSAPPDRPAIVAATYWWNRPTLRALLSRPSGPPRFCWSIDTAITRAKRNRADLYVWASRLEDRHIAQAAADNIPLWRIEDGFLRSIGLGAGFVAAASLALDRRGIYYDASRPSDLEHALEHDALSPADIETGALIRARILEARMSKYNLGQQATGANEIDTIRKRAGNRPIVLVPGQVADDASILKTISATIDPAATDNVNVELLRHARARHPGAAIIYKPHPDVIPACAAAPLHPTPFKPSPITSSRQPASSTSSTSPTTSRRSHPSPASKRSCAENLSPATAPRSTPAGASPTILPRCHAAPAAARSMN